MPGKKKQKKKEGLTSPNSGPTTGEKKAKRHNSTTGGGTGGGGDRKPGCSVLVDGGCMVGDVVDENNPGDAIRMTCTNANCDQSKFIHLNCYEHWEDILVRMLSTTSWARSWTDGQRRANLWDRKGFLLIAKACKCLCGMGQMKRDLDYKPSPDEDEAMMAGNENNNEEINENEPVVIVAEQNGAIQQAGILAQNALGGVNISNAKVKRKKKQLPSLNQADWRPGFINKQLPNVGGGPNNNNIKVSTNVNNKSTVVSPMSPAFFTDLGKTDFEINIKRPRTASIDSIVVSTQTKQKGLEENAESCKSSADTEDFLSNEPFEKTPNDLNDENNLIHGKEDLAEAILQLLNNQLNVSCIKVKDRRVQEIYSKCGQRLRSQIDSVGGMTQAIFMVCQTADGIELIKDNDADFAVSLAKNIRNKCAPVSTNQDECGKSVSQSVTAAYRKLTQTQSLPLEAEDLGQSRRRASGLIQNVFDNFGYIETKALDTNVFFVPSHVDWVSVASVDGNNCESEPKHFPSLKDAFHPGDLVKFVAIPQEERSGCCWMATKVTLLSRDGDAVVRRSSLSQLRVDTNSWPITNGTESPPLTPWEGDRRSSETGTTPSGTDTPLDRPETPNTQTNLIGARDFETPPPTPSPKFGILRRKKISTDSRPFAIGEERKLQSPDSNVFDDVDEDEDEEQSDDDDISLNQNGIECGDWPPESDVSHPWMALVAKEIRREHEIMKRRPEISMGVYDLFSPNTWQLGEQLCSGLGMFWNRPLLSPTEPPIAEEAEVSEDEESDDDPPECIKEILEQFEQI